MFCTNCGKENSDNDKFCYNCGSSLKHDKKPVQAQEQVKSRVRQTIENTHSKTHKTVGECISAALYDMKNLPGWFGRIFLLAFLSMIPIVNFFSFGYFYGLAIHAAKKENSPYPIKIITEQNFIRGFFIAVIGLLLGLVLILCVYPAFY